MIAVLLLLGLVQERVSSDARCIECHKKEAEEWKGSVHARNQAGCTACHGADDVNPAAERKHLKKAPFRAGTKNTSPALCATCHGKEVEAFKESAHWEEDVEAGAKWKAKKLQGCLSCHDPHATSEARRRALFAERCSHCHKETTVQRKRMTAYMDQADPFERDLATLKGFLHEPLPGVPYADVEGARDSGEEKYREMRVRQHSVKFKEIEKVVGPSHAAVSAAAAKQRGLNDAASVKRRKYLVIFLALLAINLLLLRAWCRKKFGGEEAPSAKPA